MTFRVLVTGSQTWPFPGEVFKALDQLYEVHGDALVVVHGDCPKGADMFAELWCRRKKVRSERHPARWDILGKRAGIVRNRHMVMTQPDLCLAFIHNGSPGATHCARLAAEYGIPTRRWIR